MFKKKKPNRVDEATYLELRKAQIYIKLVGLRYEMAEWREGGTMKRLTSISGPYTLPGPIAKQIGEFEAENDLLILRLEKLANDALKRIGK